MRKIIAALALAAGLLSATAPASAYWTVEPDTSWKTYGERQAWTRDHRWQRKQAAHARPAGYAEASRWQPSQPATRGARRAYAYGNAQVVSNPAGCPGRLFCGCGASVEVFGHSVRSLWMANAWLRFPRTSPAPGMAVVWGGGHHVAVIRQYHGDGTATLYDANSGGGMTRIHRVSIAGLTVVDPRGGGSADAGSPWQEGPARRGVRYAHLHVRYHHRWRSGRYAGA